MGCSRTPNQNKKNQFSNIIYRMISLDELSMGLKNTPENVFLRKQLLRLKMLPIKKFFPL